MINQNRALCILVCFINYRKVFDKVSWEKILQMLKLREFLDKIVNFIESFYINIKAVISINGEMSKEVQIREGV